MAKKIKENNFDFHLLNTCSEPFMTIGHIGSKRNHLDGPHVCQSHAILANYESVSWTVAPAEPGPLTAPMRERAIPAPRVRAVCPQDQLNKH